jgi:hypothetical protein
MNSEATIVDEFKSKRGKFGGTSGNIGAIAGGEVIDHK